MSMAYDYGVQDVWIVNVGDLKPMEMNISYFLDLAYDFDTYGTSNADSPNEYADNWVKQQFGNDVAEEDLDKISGIIKEYAKINGIRKPEIVTSTSYNIYNYNEALTMLNRLNTLIASADEMKGKMTGESQAAYYQLVYYPAVASANVHRMQIYAGLNQSYYIQKRTAANLYGYLLNQCIELDKELSNTYNNNMPGVGDKWKGMMSSNHVGYTAWNDVGWSYPVARMLESPLAAGMLVGVQDNLSVKESGSISLPDFTSTNQETYYIDIANSGGTAFDYTLDSNQDWITLSKESGTVISQDTVGVSVDFSKVTKNSTGKIEIQGAGKTVSVDVTATVTDVSGLDPMTFVEEHGYISMEAKHFSDNKAAGSGAVWTEIDQYGKTASAFKVLPSRQVFPNSENAPYLEYKIYVKQTGEYTLESYIAPSNNTDWNRINMSYGIKIDNGTIQTVNTLPNTNYSAGVTTDWQNYVRENIRTTQSKHTLSAGEHTIRFYSVTPELVLQKLVLFNTAKGLGASYFGPPESYYVGSEKESSLVADIQEQLYILPAVVPEAAMPADVLVPKETDYTVKINASSSSASEVSVLWNGNSIGSVEVEGDGEFEFASDIVMAYGKGKLSYEVTSGNATVKSIQIQLANPVIRYQVPGAANENEFYLDLNESRTVGTSAINAKVPPENVSENEVTYNYTEWKQRLNFALKPDQVAMIKSAQSVSVEITGTSSTEARFRYSFGDPSSQQNWNGTDNFTMDVFSNILKRTLNFSGNVNNNPNVYDYFILQLGNPNNAADTIVQSDLTIQSIKITCIGRTEPSPSALPSPVSSPVSSPISSPASSNAPSEAPSSAWVGTWGSSQYSIAASNAEAPALSNSTFRQVVRLSSGGSQFRLTFSNEYGTTPLVINSVHIAKPTNNGKSDIDTSTDTVVTFNGSESVTIPARKTVTSDAVNYQASALEKIAVSTYFGSTPSTLTHHAGSRSNSFLQAGNVAADQTMPSASTFVRWYVLSNIDVSSTSDHMSVVCFGDSITDGYGTDATYLGQSPDNYLRWSDKLAEKLQGNQETRHLSVINMGIGGNSVFGGQGPAAKDRFDRDVLQNQTGYLVFMIGVNDIGYASDSDTTMVGRITAEYDKMISKAHARGIRVFAGTITPINGNDYYSAHREEIRQEINTWLRKQYTDGKIEGLVDFDELLKEPGSNPSKLQAGYTSDYLHPNPDGYALMGNLVYEAIYNDFLENGSPILIPAEEESEPSLPPEYVKPSVEVPEGYESIDVMSCSVSGSTDENAIFYEDTGIYVSAGIESFNIPLKQSLKSGDKVQVIIHGNYKGGQGIRAFLATTGYSLASTTIAYAYMNQGGTPSESTLTETDYGFKWEFTQQANNTTSQLIVKAHAGGAKLTGELMVYHVMIKYDIS
jgi:lysophospholipase L1-like esterase